MKPVNFDFSIVPINPGMAESVHSIETVCFSDPWSCASFIEAMKNSAMSFFAAVDMAEKIIGYAGIAVAADESELLNIAVTPGSRNRGVASALLDHAFTLAEKNGAHTMYLEVRESNTPARTLYAKFGFKDIGIRKNYYTSPKENGIVMMAKINAQL